MAQWSCLVARGGHQTLHFQGYFCFKLSPSPSPSHSLWVGCFCKMKTSNLNKWSRELGYDGIEIYSGVWLWVKEICVTTYNIVYQGYCQVWLVASISQHHHGAVQQPSGAWSSLVITGPVFRDKLEVKDWKMSDFPPQYNQLYNEDLQLNCRAKHNGGYLKRWGSTVGVLNS